MEPASAPARYHDVSTTPPVLAAELAQAWADIQRHHPELPDLAAPESLIGESSSACGHELSFERLLHEAVHGIAAARGVRDTSRAGRYHNRRFLAIAEEMGLDHVDEPHPSSGFSLVALNSEAKRRYRPTIERLQRALKAHTVATASDTKRTFRGPAARHGSSGRWRAGQGRVRLRPQCPRRPVRSRPGPHRLRRLRQAFPYPGSSRRRELMASARRVGPPTGAVRHRPGASPPQVCGTMASCTRQPHRNPLASG
ncbi:hypothetical protein QFZ67_002139 [Streptomyces sp. V1I1]|nr:hypothetical protein [Streptomyces sp. V1I1]